MENKQSISRDGATSKNAPIGVVDEYKAGTDHYKQDLREFFTRSNFYLAVHAALLSLFGIREIPDTPLDYVVTIIITIAGLSLAAFWWFVARSSVWWIDRWRERVQRLSRDYSETHSYEEIEAGAIEHPYRSPERVTMYLPWLFGLIWFIFLVATLVNWLKIF